MPSVEQAILTEEKTKAFVKLQEGRLLVGHSTYVPPKLLSIVMNLHRLSGHHVEHFVGLTAGLVQSVLEGTLHAAFGFLPFRHPDLLSRKLFEEPSVVCMPRSHALAVKALIRVEDLSGESFIAIARGPLPHLHQEIEDHFNEFGIALNVVADAFAPPEAQIMVSQKVGICLIGLSAMTHALLVGKPLANQILTRKSGIFIREDNHHPALNAFVESVLSTVSSNRGRSK